MMGHHSRGEALFYYFRLEDQVPENHLLRLIDKHISFEFVRKQLKSSYSETGRPSIDPELLLRILLIGYLYGMTSERKLVEELRMHVAWRWFTGLSFDQEIPHHSTFSKNRHGRFQESKLFEQLFEQIVRQCVEVGLVEGKQLSVDGSFVEANAAKKSRVPREQLAEAAQVHHTIRQYLKELEEQNPVEEPEHKQDQVSTTDPDSTFATKGGTPARLGYYDNYLVDNHSCIIVGRSELVGLEVDEIQMRQGHWAVVDLIGKGGHIRTVPIPAWVKTALDQWILAARVTEGRIFRGVARTGKVWGAGISQNVVWYVVRSCCGRAGLEHIAPHDLRRTCAKLCHDSGGALEQIQFLLGHASVQTTERYLGCKQNLGHPVNDLFNLKTGGKPPENDVDSVTVQASASVETRTPQGVECRHGGSEHDRRVCEPRQLPLPERTDLVEIGKGRRPRSLRRCSGSRAARSDSESEANGQRDPAVVGSVGFGTLPDRTP